LQVEVRNGDIEQAARVLKKKLDRDGFKATWKLRSIPKPSERRREKERRAEARRLKKKRIH
jgi:ribosomal protein S21